ncbi:MAG: hypothetical protein EBR01_09670 [Proteobacteria bacterium]|nr:hypothetical protein [Pseudomonadota bacterium]NBY19022.1 hypothetical protein [bacterium]
MKLLFIVSLIGLNVLCAETPEPVVTATSANGIHGVVAGRLASKPERPVGVSVQNGNLIYSTITDAEGRWGVVVRVLSSAVKVNSFDLTEPGGRSAEVVHKFK